MPKHLTLLDIAKLNGHDRTVGLIEAVPTVAPELDLIPARTIKGTSYKTTLRTGLPTGGFRAFNKGGSRSKSAFAVKDVQVHPYQLQVAVDKQLADAYEDGAEALQAIEAIGVMEGAKIQIGRQVIYGISNDELGFPGLKHSIADDMIVDATGSTVAGGSSVYALKFGNQDVQLLFGQGSTFDLSDFRLETAYDNDNKPFVAYVAELTALAGLQVVNPTSVARIKNLTAQEGKTLNDAKIADLLAKDLWKGTPDVLLMSRRSCRQLQQSRTVVIHSGAGRKPTGKHEAVAPWPTEAFGIPIVVTDSIVNTEAIA